MRFKQVWQVWGPLLVSVAMGLGAFLLRRAAWNTGYSANAISLLGCHFLRFILLLLAWLVIVSAFKVATGKDKPDLKKGFTLFEGLSSLSILLGCMGCFPAWPVVLLVSAPLVPAVMVARKAMENPPPETNVLRFGIVVLLFNLTWYVASTTTDQALRGLGQRIEEKGGSDKLIAWSKEIIAAENAREQAQPAVAAAAVGLTASPRGQGALLASSALIAAKVGSYWRGIEPEELPEWINDLLGRFQGVRGAVLEGSGENTCVALYTGGSAFHFRITICPSRTQPRSVPLWFGDVPGQWRPEIELNTEGK